VRFCSNCGADVHLVRPEGDDRERFVCSNCQTIHYLNPKIVVGSVCTWQDRLLLCRRAIEPRVGFWTIPAGWLENGETAEEGAMREAREEACAEIAIEGLIAVYSIRRIQQVQILFRARLLSPDVAAGPESQEVRLVEWDEIPWNHLAFPTVDWVLRRALDLRGIDQWPATFNPEPA
jgi:ADP-ribose pyrophosphatase YjhB (NUDIX family)